MAGEEKNAAAGSRRRFLLIALAACAVAAAAVSLWRLRAPLPPGPRGFTQPRERKLATADPVSAATAEVVAAYRKVIVLLHDDTALPPADRDRASLVGRVIFEENRQRLASLTDQLIADLQAVTASTGASAPGKVERFLDEVEKNADFHDADKLAFRDVLEDVAAFLRESLSGSQVTKGLEARIADDLKALRDIQALYEKELAAIFSRLRPREMAVRREAWERYVAFLRTRYDRAAILQEYGERAMWPADTRGRAGPGDDTPLEVFGRSLPPNTLVLTFDDGPHYRYTPRILEILKRFNAAAVFFQVGRNIGTIQGGNTVTLTRAAEASRQVVAAGMPLGNHSYTHALLPKLGDQELAQEIERTSRLLRQVAPSTTLLFRAPYGARSQQLMAALKARNLRSIMWNIDSRDWADPVPRSIADRVLRAVDAEGRGIILFHDIHERTVEALPPILEALQADGYQFASWTGNAFAVRGIQGGGAEVREAPPAPAPPAAYRESWAVVVGIDDYAKWPKLRYAVNDANAVKDLLVRKYNFKSDHVFTLLNGEATRRNILSMLGDRLGDQQMVKRDDRVFVFFAGHGATRKLPSGRDLGYIVPVEADPENYYGQSISMTNFQDIAEAIPAKHVLFVMDACYSGLALTRGGRPDRSANYLREVARRTARQVFTAGGADQQVADNGPNGHSIFTWTLMQALEGKGDLNGDGFITASEVAAYTGPIVSSLSRQTPAFGNMPGSEGGEFVFELTHETEFLSGLSAQLDQEAIRLNSEIERLRAEIAKKSVRNQQLQRELARTQGALTKLEAKSAPAGSPAKAESLWTRNDRGMSLFKERRYPQALKEFLAAATLAPANALAANNVGYTYYKMQQLQEATLWFEKAVALDPKRAVAYLNLGDAYVELQRKPEARKAFERYLELQPQSKSAAYAREKLKELE